MNLLVEALVALGLGVALLLLGTLTFDALHILLHRWASSRLAPLRWIGSLHGVHHAFLDRELRIHRELIPANVFCHVIPEYLVQVAVTLTIGVLLQLPGGAIVVALGLETLVFALIIKPTPGFDVNHRPIEQLRAYRPQYFCLPEYHLLHHVYPDAYFGSWLKTLDHMLGTGTSLKGRSVAITGGATQVGQGLQRELLADCPVVDLDEKLLAAEAELTRVMQGIEILVLCHEEENGTDYRELIERYAALHRERRIPVEVWAVTSAGEFSDRTNFANYAKGLFRAGKVIYRHLVIPKNREHESWSALHRRIRRGHNYVAARWDKPTVRHAIRFLRP